MTENIIDDDVRHIAAQIGNLWEELRGKQIFITGGTGFFGRWFLESFLYANEQFGLNARITVLTRDADLFRAKAPSIAKSPAISFCVGDVRNFDFPSQTFDYVIHAAATSAVATFNNEDSLIKFDTIVNGTRRVLDFSVQCGAKKILYTSSGAMYGKQPSAITHIPEDYLGAPDPTDINSAWGEGKRVAEFLCSYYGDKYEVEIKIARCFSFVGPYLPLDIHYAIGNFIQDGLNGRSISVSGDGTPFRSYLYSSDLMIWLWTILFRGEAGRSYNVGSEESITIAQLANEVARHFSDLGVSIAKKPMLNASPVCYVPSTARARSELGLKQTINLQEAIRRTVVYYASF